MTTEGNHPHHCNRRFCCLHSRNHIPFGELLTVYLYNHRCVKKRPKVEFCDSCSSDGLSVIEGNGLSFVYRDESIPGLEDDYLFLCGNLCWNVINFHFKHVFERKGKTWGLARGCLSTSKSNEKHFVWDMTYTSPNEDTDGELQVTDAEVWFLLPKCLNGIFGRFLKTLLGLKVYKSPCLELLGTQPLGSDSLINLPHKMRPLYFVHFNDRAAQFMSDIRFDTVQPENFFHWLRSFVFVLDCNALRTVERFQGIKCEAVPPSDTEHVEQCSESANGGSVSSQSSSDLSDDIKVDELDLSSLKEEVSDEQQPSSSGSTVRRLLHPIEKGLKEDKVIRIFDKETQHFISVLTKFNDICKSKDNYQVWRACFPVKVVKCPECGAAFYKDNTRLYRMVRHVLTDHAKCKRNVMQKVMLQNNRMFQKIESLMSEM